MSVFELTESFGETLTPVGFSLLRYNMADGGAGPAASAAGAATFHSAAFQIDYDIAVDSPLQTRQTDIERRDTNGVKMTATDTNGRWFLAGMTSSWTTSATSDTLQVVWSGEALAAAASLYVYAQVGTASPVTAFCGLPDDPSLWTGCTVHDPPVLAGLVGEQIPFDREVPLVTPSWADHVSLFILFFPEGDGEVRYWSVTFHPEVASFTMSALAWPSSVDREAFVSARRARATLGAHELDEDPFDRYANWTDLAWYERHWVSRTENRIYDLETP